MNNKIYSPLLLATFLSLNIFGLISCKRGPETVKPQVKPLTEAVYASGLVVSDREYQVFAQADGVLVQQLVQEGEPVKPGQALLGLESTQQNARSGFARDAYQMATKNYQAGSPVLREALTAVQTAKTKMAYDSTNYRRYQRLWENTATTKAELERMKLLYDNSRSDYTAQRSRYAKLRNQLYLEQQNAKSNLQVAQDEQAHFQLKSQIKGTLLKMLKEPGELVRRGEAVAVVGQLDQFYLRLKVDELDIQRVKTGQEMLVKIDAYPNKIFKARVAKIYPIVDPRDQSLRVDATLLDALPGYYSGLALEANIIINQKIKTLVIPRRLLLPGDSVELNQNGGARKVKITKGAETLTEVEIVAGLTPDPELINR